MKKTFSVIIAVLIGASVIPLTADAASFSATSYGSVYVSNATWATARGASSGTSRTNPGYAQGVWNGSAYFIERGFLVFNTSALGAGCTVASAYITLTGAAILNNGTNLETYNIYSSTGGTTVSGSDYNKAGSAAFSTAIAQTSLAASGNFTWNLNSSGLAQINKTGNTFFSVREATYDVANNPGVNTAYWGFNTPTLNVTCGSKRKIITVSFNVKPEPFIYA